MTWRGIEALGQLRILGVFGGLFVAIDAGARLWLVDSTDGSGMKQDISDVSRYQDHTGRPIVNPSWHASVFLNSTPEAFAMCLVAYKEMREVMERETYDFDRPAIRSAVALCRQKLESAEPSALIEEDSFWSQILSDVEVW